MAARIRGERDFGIGVLYLGLGVGGFIIAQHYAFGTPRQMGPGFFPSIISGLLVVFGITALVRGLALHGEPLGRWNFKGMALITGSVVAFGLTLAPLGLPLAIIISTLTSAAASEKFRFDWRALAGLGLLAAVCSIVFVRLLGVPMPLLGSWLHFIPL